LQTTGGGAAMAGMFSPEMMKMAQEQMANMTPEQMQAMQRQVRVHALAASGPCARTRRGASAPVPPARGGRAPSRRALDSVRARGRGACVRPRETQGACAVRAPVTSHSHARCVADGKHGPRGDAGANGAGAGYDERHVARPAPLPVLHGAAPFRRLLPAPVPRPSLRGRCGGGGCAATGCALPGPCGQGLGRGHAGRCGGWARCRGRWQGSCAGCVPLVPAWGMLHREICAPSRAAVLLPRRVSFALALHGEVVRARAACVRARVFVEEAGGVGARDGVGRCMCLCSPWCLRTLVLECLLEVACVCLCVCVCARAPRACLCL